MKYLALLLLIVSSGVSAAWEHYVYPEIIVNEGSDVGSRAYVVFEQKFPTNTCKGDGNYIRIYGDTQKGQYFISTILTALAANKKVRPHISGCDDWGRPVLRGLMMSRNK